ncbi:DUF6148 family protein [Bradyrhizobium xenonodulans]|uniref:DUF6148 family protein n=1 Tax=Bradyrhizobium xenonodulans TaxID=2736875 RepID=A0ABY7MBH6_9BRAD|nr:DUF6148 family protein [Bradyrhizobium xenonodulans]WBL75608.1 DUF6148 family protein [Bradyrhizobium xenonodulans]
MAGITLEQAQAQLATWIAASTAVAASQSYEIETGNGRRKLQRADAAEIRQMIEFWDAQVKTLTPAAAGGRRRTRYIVPE